MNKLKKSWYIWLSFFAFALLSGDTSRRIKFSKVSYVDNLELWGRAWWHIVKIFFTNIIAPILLFAYFVAPFVNEADENSMLPEVIMFILLIMLYLLGVHATYRHMIWWEKNISHLLSKSYPRRKNIFNSIVRLFSSKKTDKTDNRE